MTQRDRIIFTLSVLAALVGIAVLLFVCVLAVHWPLWAQLLWFGGTVGVTAYGLTYLPPMGGR